MFSDVLSAIARALSFVAICQAAGMAIFLAMFGSRLPQAFLRIKAVAMISAVAGILLVSLHYLLEAARMAGELAGIFDADLQQLVLNSATSTAAGLRILGLVLILMAMSYRGVRLAAGALCGAGCVVASFAFVGHTANGQNGAWAPVLLLVHVAVVTFWFGSLAPLMLVNRMEPRDVAAQIVAQFSRIAAWTVPAILVAGLILMTILIGGWAGLNTPYAWVLLAKIGAFAILMSLAALNRWRFGPALAARPAAAVPFHRAVLAEYVLIVAVLGATAVLTTFLSPESSM